MITDALSATTRAAATKAHGRYLAISRSGVCAPTSPPNGTNREIAALTRTRSAPTQSRRFGGAAGSAATNGKPPFRIAHAATDAPNAASSAAPAVKVESITTAHWRPGTRRSPLSCTRLATQGSLPPNSAPAPASNSGGTAAPAATTGRRPSPYGPMVPAVPPATARLTVAPPQGSPRPGAALELVGEHLGSPRNRAARTSHRRGPRCAAHALVG